MELDTKQPQSFKFESPRQEKVYGLLKRLVGNAPAGFYKDAAKIMSRDTDLEAKTNLVGHLLREVFGWIIDIMIPVDYVDSNSDGNYRQKVLDAANSYGITVEHELLGVWLDKVVGKRKKGGLHTVAHKNDMEVIRPVDDEFDSLWRDITSLLEFLLDKIQNKYLTYTDQIDQLLAKDDIRKSDISKLKKHVPMNPTTLKYLFDRLEDPQCLPMFKARGYFEHPRLPMEHENGGVSYPFWAPMTYLIKMANVHQVQKQVLDICLTIETDNINTREDILNVIMNLPPDMAVQLAKNCYDWFDKVPSWFRADKYADVCVYLATNGYPNESLDILSRLLAIKPDPRESVKVEGGYTIGHSPVALFDDWHYEKVLTEQFPKIEKVTDFDSTKVLMDKLEEYIQFSSESKGYSKDDISEVWRPSIEDHSQNHKHGSQDLLVTAIRSSCERILQSEPVRNIELVEELESRQRKIFNRLALHLLRLYPDGAEQMIVDRLMNENEFTRERLTHEYFLLAEAHSQKLDEDQCHQIWDWIMSGVDIENYKKWVLQNGKKPTEIMTKKYEKNWQMYHLMPFKDCNPKWKEYFNALIELVGEPKFPSFRSWTSGGSFGPSSSISKDELKSMKVSEIIDYMRTWKPKSKTVDPTAHSREGIGRIVTGLIANEPEAWTGQLPTVVDLDPTYISSILTGFRDALKKQKQFDWKPILDLCEVILGKPIEVNRKRPSGFYGDDPDWRWSRNTIISLLDDGMKNDRIDISLRDKVWSIIDSLSNDPEPTPKEESERLGNDRDPLNLAINTTRGNAIDAVIQYGIWLKQSVPENKQKVWSLSKNSPELLQVLNNHLDTKIEPSLAIRAVYGQRLTNLAWLDKPWLSNSVKKLFPAAKAKAMYWNAAWDAYIVFSKPYDEMFKILSDEYLKAVQMTTEYPDNQSSPERPEAMLVHHLMTYYWRGLLPLTDKESLLNMFYETANTELKAEAIEYIGRVVKNDDQVPDEIKKRFEILLEHRIGVVKEAEGTTEDAQEFEGIGWWVASKKFDDQWMLNQLIQILELRCDMDAEYLVMERFVEIADQYPEETIKCTRMMVENDQKGWGTARWRDHLKQIIKLVLKTNNEEAKQLTQDLVNMLGSRGLPEYKDLIAKN